MTNLIPHHFQGFSGSWYNFSMSDLPTKANAGCGVYIFGRRRTDGLYDVLYIGRASRISDRVTQTHEKLGPALTLGMTTLGQATCANDTDADIIERDLIARFNPPLNRHHRTG